MSSLLTRQKLLLFLSQLGERAKSKGACYLTGGASAVLLGWRETTLDVDVKFDPEPLGVFDAIPDLKRTLQVNVELASPDDFVPVAEGWRDRSQFIDQYGNLSVYHFDFTAPAIAKVERGHPKDIADVQEMLRRGLTSREAMQAAIDATRKLIRRYPSIDEDAFVRRLQAFLKEGR